MKKQTLLLAVVAAIINGSMMLSLSSCEHQEITTEATVWADTSLWYLPSGGVDPDRVDVLYLVSTEVLQANDENGQETWQATLTESDRKAIGGEMAWIEKQMFDDGFNLFSPYYHQFTFGAICQLQGADFDAVYQQVADEACDAFDYYMEHYNQGRPFVLAGFSQGAMLTLDLLKHMSDKQYAQMVACYSIGYRLSADDLKHPHIRAAQGETDRGVVVSFNSTQSLDAIWPLVSQGACTCINPMNWHTDETPATFTFEGTTNTVHVDTAHQVLLVCTDDPAHYQQWMDQVPIFAQAGAKRDNLHHWDLLFYTRQIHDNALKRAN